MQVIKSTRLVCFDVDETLALTERPYGFVSNCIEDVETGQTFWSHDRHIKLLKQFKARGFTILVWSQGGAAWAKLVLKAYKIDKHVDFVMDKPTWVVDDLPVSAWIGPSIYLHPTDKSKDTKR